MGLSFVGWASLGGPLFAPWHGIHDEAWGGFPVHVWWGRRSMPECFHDGGLSCDSSHKEGTWLVWEVTLVWVHDVTPSGGDGKVMVLEGEDNGLEAPP